MLAERTDEIIRQFIAFINVSTDLADKSFLSFCLRSGLYIVLVIGVCHGLTVVHNTCLCNGTDEHAVRIQINILVYLQRNDSVDIFWQDDQPVVGADRIPSFKLVCSTAALESKILEYAERSVDRETVDI